jgi:hypothetical protein
MSPLPPATCAPAPKSFAVILPHLLVLPTIALVLSALMSWAHVGFGDAFLGRWGRGFVTSLIVLPVILASLGVLEAAVTKVTGALPRLLRKVLVALVAACVIECVLALVVTLVNVPMADFGASWWLAFTRSLPAGIVIGLFMTFYMKPKLDRMSQAARAAQA